MSTQKESQAAATQTEATTTPLLDQALARVPKAMKKDGVGQAIEALIDGVTQGTATQAKSVSNTIKNLIDAIDEKLSKQLAAIMHNPELQKLEGSWRGLWYLVYNTETSVNLKLRVLNG